MSFLKNWLERRRNRKHYKSVVRQYLKLKQLHDDEDQFEFEQKLLKAKFKSIGVVFISDRNKRG